LEKFEEVSKNKRPSQLLSPSNKKASSRENPSKKHIIKKHFIGNCRSKNGKRTPKLTI
jgi:hypothetical protein